VCNYVPQKQKGTRLVSKMVAEKQEYTVNVCNYVQQKQKGTRLGSKMEAEKEEDTQTVAHCQQVTGTGGARGPVCGTVPAATVQEEVEQPMTTCQMVAVRVRVRVPVCVPVAPAPAPAPCLPGGFVGAHH